MENFYGTKLALLRTLETTLLDADHILGRLEQHELGAAAGEVDDIVDMSKRIVALLENARNMKDAVVPMSIHR